MELLNLPVEVLSKIISLCGPGAVTETCRTVADIATSTPSLWTFVHLGPLQCVPEGREHLRTRLSRAAKSLLTVSIGPADIETSLLSPGEIFTDLCTILSEWNKQIAHLQILVEEEAGDGWMILSAIFHNSTSVVFSALRSLSVSVVSEELNAPMDFAPSSTLSGLHKNFPCLQLLSIPNFSHWLSSFPRNATFSHLRTLALVDCETSSITDICAVTELLSNTPQLETLWLKHEDQISDENPTQNWEEYEEGRPLRVFLPKLIRLAVSAPGTGMDLLHCLEVPCLEDLHIDGSRQCSERYYDCDLIEEAMKSLASRSSGLRRLAYTQIDFSKDSLEWLLFGDDGRPPFPKLETLALHDSEETDHPVDPHDSGETDGPYDDLLLQFAKQPTIPLRRLVIMMSSFCTLSSLIPVYQKLIADAPHKKYELEIYLPPWLQRIAHHNLETLKDTGVKLILHHNEKPDTNEWWTLGYQVDPLDSYAY